MYLLLTTLTNIALSLKARLLLDWKHPLNFWPFLLITLNVCLILTNNEETIDYLHNYNCGIETLENLQP